MLLSSTPLIFGNYATAATGAANFLPNVYYPTYFDTVNEVQRSHITTYYVTSLLNYRYSGACYERINSSASITGYQTVLNTLKLSHDKGVIFSKGHRTVLNVNGYPHYGIIPHPGTSYLDYEFYSVTSTNNVVTFLWHCETAYNYASNGIIPKDPNGLYYGLPYCLTHNANLGYFNTAGSQVYLGWTNKYNFVATYPDGTQVTHALVGSPQYEWKINPNNDYGRVAELYWYYMFSGKSTIDALNEAMKGIEGVGYGSSAINGWLIIWGNQNLKLP